jgi:predicted nuclease of predicted toxin-antitoxin system
LTLIILVDGGDASVDGDLHSVHLVIQTKVKITLIRCREIERKNVIFLADFGRFLTD